MPIYYVKCFPFRVCFYSQQNFESHIYEFFILFFLCMHVRICSKHFFNYFLFCYPAPYSNSITQSGKRSAIYMTDTEKFDFIGITFFKK